MPEALAKTECGHYEMVSPDGRKISVAKEVFDAFAYFLGPRRPPGSTEIGFLNGGITRVKTLTEWRLK